MNQYLTELCTECDGTGVNKHYVPIGGNLDCVNCNGYGKLPNDVGKEIIELIKVFGKRNYIC